MPYTSVSCTDGLISPSLIQQNIDTERPYSIFFADTELEKLTDLLTMDSGLGGRNLIQSTQVETYVTNKESM